MASPTELIDALRRRARARRPQRAPGEMPPGWSAWFAAMGERVGAVTGASADEIAAALGERPPAAIAPPVPAVGRWRAFNALWRQQWQPVGRDERWLRITGYASSFLIHLLLMVLLLWLALVRLAPAPTSAPEGIDAVQVEFLGDGTPQDTGGGAAAAPGEQTAAAQPTTVAAAAPAAPATPTAPAASSNVDRVVQVVQIERTPPPQPAGPQPLVVTQVAVPDTTFVLPPPTPPVLRAVQVPVPQVRAPTAEARVVDIPAPAVAVAVETPPAPKPPAPVPPAPTPPAPQPPTPALPDPVVREVPEPLRIPVIATPTLHALPAAVPQLPAQVAEARTRDVPGPPAPAASAPTPAGPTPATSASSAAADAAPAASTSGTASRADAQAAGKGPSANAPPGAQPGPRRGDDWAGSDRNRTGGQTGRSPGLFNADGTARLAPGTNAAAGGGLPPGTIRQDIADLDHAGSWLKRKPNDFETTSLDQYWVPSESLLAEWVRKSIKEVLIPVPGTGKTVKCTVVLLMLGGGCGISDPNLQDIEATARPPPDIPFKRELQEPPRPPPA